MVDNRKQRFIRFLRKPRFETFNPQRAEKSIFQWGEIASLYNDKRDYGWYLSILGIVNGFVSFIGCVIVIDYDQVRKLRLGGEIVEYLENPKIRLRKKWW